MRRGSLSGPMETSVALAALSISAKLATGAYLLIRAVAGPLIARLSGGLLVQRRPRPA